MTDPWFDPNTFGAWFGAVAGGGLGSLVGLLGAAAGVLAPRGKCKRIIISTWTIVLGIAALMLIFGGYAWVVGQPRAIWYGPVLGGAVLSAIMGGLLPMILARYRQAEYRRIDAAGLRTT